jgi:pilus assembly protein Flp/PilA
VAGTGTNNLVAVEGATMHIGEALIRGWVIIIQENHHMALIQKFLVAIRRDEEGQGLAEYALILALIAIIAIVALIFLGGQVSTILSNVGHSV